METPESKKIDQNRALVEKLKLEWTLMWTKRFDDKTRAEGVSAEEYSLLKVDRGTVIHATRDYKALDFKEVLEENGIKESYRFIQPHKETGGWTKFAKKEIIPHTPRSKRLYPEQEKENRVKNASDQQPKKGGRGWLHSAK